MLIVDSEPAIRFAVREYFSALHFHVDCADEPLAAAALLRERSYRTLVIESSARDVEARRAEHELVAAARRADPRVRVVLLTSASGAEVERHARALGADALLLKPQPLSELAALVRRLLGEGEPH